MNNFKDFITDFIRVGEYDQKTLLKAKRLWSKKYKKMLPRNSDIYRAYQTLVRAKPGIKSEKLAELLHIRKVRTISGVAPVAVLTKPFPCPGKCIYCPVQTDMPKSYLNDEPAVMRAVDSGFDPYLQVQKRLAQYLATGHTPEKIELIVMGGSFSALPDVYKFYFIRRLFEACNDFPRTKKSRQKLLSQENKQLLAAQRKNETSKYRVVGLTLETRPDLINKREIKLMRRLGCTRVEIGVQSTDDRVLKTIKRGHGTLSTIKATGLLKDNGFKVCYHMMPNLPGSSQGIDLAMFKKIYSDEKYMPDMVKIYPCVVTRSTGLFHLYKQGKYRSYTDKELIELMIKIKQTTPRWVRINRLYRDIPAINIVSGSKTSNLRQVLQNRMIKAGKKCQCIRCREAGYKKFKIKNLKLKILSYRASGGEEYFLEYINDKDILFALLRLRFPAKNITIFPELSKTAIVRELHTFGKALGVNDNKKRKTQHRGLGLKLMQKAEKIAIDKDYKKIAVIAGVGAREYYRKLGYKLKNTYMVKAFK